MTWQPIRTAPKDGEKVWITYQWRGGLFVSCDHYPFLTDALAWQPVDLGKPSPSPYAGSVEGLEAAR